MSDKRYTAEKLAQKFHEAYERLALSFGYETRKASAKPWSEVPDQNKRLMIAVCAEIQQDALNERDSLEADRNVWHANAAEWQATAGVLEQQRDALREALVEALDYMDPSMPTPPPEIRDEVLEQGRAALALGSAEAGKGPPSSQEAIESLRRKRAKEEYK